ncbi:MAG: NUDIX hydrolase [Rhodospirillaceae bacterium]
MQREYPGRPWVGVGVVVWRGGELLLIRRGNSPRQGQWGLPGGAQVLGETILEAAVREVREETGLTVNPTGVITACDGISRDEDGKVLYHYTLVEVGAEYDGDSEPNAGADALDARWVALEDVASFVEWSETLRVIMMSAEQRRK